MIQTATAAKRIRRLPSRLAARRQRKKSRISRNGATTRKIRIALPARARSESCVTARRRPAIDSANADRQMRATDADSQLTFSASGTRPASRSASLRQAASACRAPSDGRRARPRRAAPQGSAARARPAGRRSGNRRPRRAASAMPSRAGKPGWLYGERHSCLALPRMRRALAAGRGGKRRIAALQAGSPDRPATSHHAGCSPAGRAADGGRAGRFHATVVHEQSGNPCARIGENFGRFVQELCSSRGP